MTKARPACARYLPPAVQDVRIQIEDSVAVVVVEERPVISRVEFVGTKGSTERVVKS